MPPRCQHRLSTSDSKIQRFSGKAQSEGEGEGGGEGGGGNEGEGGGGGGGVPEQRILRLDQRLLDGDLGTSDGALMVH